uniref:Small ribosomal subunit protein uS3m n=1 Tax=Phaeoplaca camptidia TaxID=2488735 RepID=A0A8K1W0M6_9LECA|nr:ribosomal protein S3 [Phaeoplaca camptidia]
MLNILNLKKKQYNKNVKLIYNENINEISEIRHYPPANKEWFNSIYAYNKDTSKLLPSADKVILKLIKSYFNLYSRKLDNKTKSPHLIRRLKRLSTNRILVSKAELKHTSDKVIITIYLYNRQKRYYINRVKNLSDVFKYLKPHKYDSEKIALLKENYIKLLKGILINVKEKVKNIMSRILLEKKIFLNRPFVSNILSDKIKLNENRYLKNLVKKSLGEIMLRLYYEQIYFFNKSKLSNMYLLAFSNLIKTVYNKNVDFNLVNLKYLHLNSYIFTETIVTKLKNKKNRLLKVLRASLSRFKLPIENKLATYNDIYNRNKTKQNLKLDNFLKDPLFKIDLKNKDILQEMLDKLSKNNFFKKYKLSNDCVSSDKKEELSNTVLDSIKYKSVSGLRIEAAGRLTRRNTAARSVFKLRYKGNIRNLDSSYKGLSSVLLRGYAKSNVQHTKLKSKLRIGSFGIKGWVSSN